MRNYRIESNKQREKRGLEKINVLTFIIPPPISISCGSLKLVQLESLYNLQSIKKNNEYTIHTTIFSDLKKLLSISAVASEIVTEKLNTKISKLKDFEISLEVLKQKQKNIAKDLELAECTTDEIDNNDNTVNHQSNILIIPDVNEIPKLCFDKNNQKRHEMCTNRCNYSIYELKNLQSLRLEDELAEHGHPRKLTKFKNKYYSLDERREELIAHYKVFHKIQ